MIPSKISIALTDDDKEEHVLFRDALFEHNVDVSFLSFNHGNELLDYLHDETSAKPDLLFLDLNMPLLTGIECLEKIRENKTFNSLPVIIYSTSTAESDIAETYRLGADLYVSKPTEYADMAGIFATVFASDWKQMRESRSFENFFRKTS